MKTKTYYTVRCGEKGTAQATSATSRIFRLKRDAVKVAKTFKECDRDHGVNNISYWVDTFGQVNEETLAK